MYLVSSCSCLCPCPLSREWRCSWSSPDRRCCNYIWVINNFIAYQRCIWCQRFDSRFWYDFLIIWWVAYHDGCRCLGTNRHQYISIHHADCTPITTHVQGRLRPHWFLHHWKVHLLGVIMPAWFLLSRYWHPSPASISEPNRYCQW